MTRLSSLSDALELLVASFEGEREEWEDVLARSRQAPAAPGRSRRGPAVLAAALVLLASAATPFGRALVGDTLSRLGSWLEHDPGRPASREQQRAFERENARSYAAFPRGTQLRRLASARVAGRRFDLLGFRTEHALCLELVRAWIPRAAVPTCVPKAYLRQIEIPAVVVELPGYALGDPAILVDGVVGFAADDVARIELEREQSGRSGARIVNNVFLALRGRTAPAAADYPRPDGIVRLWAVTRDGERALVPLVARSGGDYGARRPPGPAYLRWQSTDAARLPGPSAVTAPVASAHIGWLERRGRRGGPLTRKGKGRRDRGLPTGFARVIQPDPGDPFRVALTRWRRSPKGEFGVCVHELYPLARRAFRSGCLTLGALAHKRGPRQALALTGWGQSAWTRLTGAAVDGVSRIELFLRSGRHFPVPLRDNAFSVQAPYAEFPAKLVAYDRDQEVVGISVVPGPSRPTPCPRAVFAGSVAELPRPRRFERVDLGARTIGGHQILGRTVPEVVRALGPPARIHPALARRDVTDRYLRYGSSGPEAALHIRFRPRGGRLVAISLTFGSPSLDDVRLGHVLRMQPERLQRGIARAYRREYRLAVAYGSIPALGCGGAFRAKGMRRTIDFGLNPHRPSRPFLSIRRR